MAWDKPVLLVGQYTASSDYNDAADQFCAVRLTTSLTLVKTAGSTKPALGILYDRPSSGVAGQVAVMGVVKARVLSTAHTAIVAGSKLAPGASGGIVPSTVAGHYILGRSMDTLAANTAGIITMLITHEGLHGTTGSVGLGDA